MSDLRWSDCDELAASDPIGCLLCRTGKLNDHAHRTDIELSRIQSHLSILHKHINWFGIATTALSLVGAVVGLAKALHG